MTIYQFSLFNEWRGISIYGESLKDAILRKKTLQRPDKFNGGLKVAEGEEMHVKNVIGIADVSNTINVMRDMKQIERAIVETDSGQIVEVDATRKEVFFTEGGDLHPAGE